MCMRGYRLQCQALRLPRAFRCLAKRYFRFQLIARDPRRYSTLATCYPVCGRSPPLRSKAPAARVGVTHQGPRAAVLSAKFCPQELSEQIPKTLRLSVLGVNDMRMHLEHAVEQLFLLRFRERGQCALFKQGLHTAFIQHHCRIHSVAQPRIKCP